MQMVGKSTLGEGYWCTEAQPDEHSVVLRA